MLISAPTVTLIRLLRILLRLPKFLDSLLEHLIGRDHVGVLLLELLHLPLQLLYLGHAPVVAGAHHVLNLYSIRLLLLILLNVVLVSVVVET